MDENDVIDDFGESVAELDDLDFEPKSENSASLVPSQSAITLYCVSSSLKQLS